MWLGTLTFLCLNSFSLGLHSRKRISAQRYCGSMNVKYRFANRRGI